MMKNTSIENGLRDLESASILAANIPGWQPHQYETARNAILVTGAVFLPVTRGKRKGEPNWRQPILGTKCTVAVNVRSIGKGPIR